MSYKEFVKKIDLNRGIMGHKRDFGLFNGDVTLALAAYYAGMEWELRGFPRTKAEFDKNFKLVRANGHPMPTWDKLMEQMTEMQEEYKKIEYRNNRLEEYPDLNDVIIALAEKAEGRSEMWDEIVAKRSAVRTKYPKE